MNEMKKPSEAYKSDINYHLEELKIDINRTKLDRNRDFNLMRILNSYYERLNIIRELVDNDPRFDWKKIQLEMDRLYKQDKSITGFNILFNINDNVPIKRTLLIYNLTTHFKNLNIND